MCSAYSFVFSFWTSVSQGSVAFKLCTWVQHCTWLFAYTPTLAYLLLIRRHKKTFQLITLNYRVISQTVANLFKTTNTCNSTITSVFKLDLHTSAGLSYFDGSRSSKSDFQTLYFRVSSSFFSIVGLAWLWWTYFAPTKREISYNSYLWKQIVSHEKCNNIQLYYWEGRRKTRLQYVNPINSRVLGKTRTCNNSKISAIASCVGARNYNGKKLFISRNSTLEILSCHLWHFGWVLRTCSTLFDNFLDPDV